MSRQSGPRTPPRPQRVEMSFLESVRRRLPAHQRTLEALGHLYTRTGRFADGLQVDEALTRLRPEDPVAWYNLACSQALTGQPESALQALGRALELGYDDVEWIRGDPDLKSLQDDPRFQALLADRRRPADGAAGAE